MDFTVVIGIDRSKIDQFRLVFPTWKQHKPSLLHHKFCIFYDAHQVDFGEISDIVGHGFADCQVDYIAWARDAIYPGDGSDKWSNPQRNKMLSGFVHVPARCVTTPYWLKLDLDVVATGIDGWVDQQWFDGNPSIIAPSWGYSKPADIIQRLDAWANSLPQFDGSIPLGFAPNPGSDKVIHPRICSWCAFFNTEFTRYCARLAETSCPIGHIPIPSQDTFHGYVAARLGFKIRTVRMKRCGWKLCSSMSSIKDAIQVVGV